MANQCLGLFELDDGINRNHIIFDDGRVFYFNENLVPTRLNTSDNITFANDAKNLYSAIKVGSHMMFADDGSHTPYKWTNGDAQLSKLIASGTEFKFKYLEQFQRRVVGAYTSETNGDISVRWSTAWPTISISNLNFPIANQLYVPNDDPIRGIRTMRADQCFVYSRRSINQLVYFPDYEIPFRFYTVVPQQGAEGNAGIVNLGDRHYLFNQQYGFCEYRGGPEFPYGGRPISENIETDIRDMHVDYFDRIVGTYYPLTREVAWLINLSSESTPSHIAYYNIDNKQWRIEDRPMRFIDNWLIYLNYTWNDLDSALGGSATWNDAGTHSWGFYTSLRPRLVYMGTDGKLYYHDGNSLDGADLDGYRIEPVLDFNDPNRYDLLSEIWFDVVTVGNYSLHTWHRSGDTVGECTAAAWVAQEDLSLNSPQKACVHVNQSGRFHQIKWGTNSKDERFQVGRITFKYIEQGSF